MRVTLRDILADYRKFRHAYYFVTVKHEEPIPPVDPKTFSFKSLVRRFFDPKDSTWSGQLPNATRLLFNLLTIMAFFYFYKFWYRGWHKRREQEMEETAISSSQDLEERMRYSRRVK